jgi:response regulator RpfG family c-di-GMP phosphodiesterase
MSFVQSATLGQELSEKELLDLLFRYNIKIASERRLDRLLVLMADLGRRLVVADRCSLWLLDEDKGELWTKVAHGVAELRMPYDCGLVGHCIASGESILVDDVYNNPHFNREMDALNSYKTQAVLVIPIRNNEGKVMGAYQAVNKLTQAAKFSAKDLEHLTLIATYSGKSLETAMLLKEIEDTQREIIFTMSEVGEMRSKETGNHVMRVAQYCYLLAQYHGLAPDECELLRMAAPMHDIGKIGIPDSILKKPGKLTVDEFEVMKTHSMLGYEMLKNSRRPILKAAAIVAKEHHEKYDGTGYPNGSKGDEIHIYGRICAIADVFDALACERVYKKAWPLDKVLDLFRNEKNKHFDGCLVDLMFEHLPEFEEIGRLYKDH